MLINGQITTPDPPKFAIFICVSFTTHNFVKSQPIETTLVRWSLLVAGNRENLYSDRCRRVTKVNNETWQEKGERSLNRSLTGASEA